MSHFDEDLLLKKLRGNTSPEEDQLINDWLSVSEANRKSFAHLHMLWQAGRINEYSTEKVINPALKEFNRRVDVLRSSSRRLRINKLMKYAAVFAGIAVVAVTLLLLVPRPETLMIGYNVPVNGEIRKVDLPDGSKVWLNQGSILMVPSEFREDKRIVSLKGEAFFEVVKDQHQRFIVETDKLNIEVTGTSFNVNTNVSGNLMQTVLVSGSISLTGARGREVVKLKPDEMALFDPSNKSVSISKVNTRVYTAWQEGLVVFEKAALKEIIEKLSEVYEVEFEYDTDRLSSDTNRYNFVFRKSQNFDTVYSMLKFIAPANSVKVRKAPARDPNPGLQKKY